MPTRTKPGGMSCPVRVTVSSTFTTLAATWCGAIQAPQRSGADTAGSGIFDPHAPGEPGDYPLPPRDGPALRDRIDLPLATAALLPLTESSPVLIPTLSIASRPRGRIEEAA